MINMNTVIANNVLSLLRQKDKKQNDLATVLGVSKQTMSKMLSGNRAINAVELMQTAEFFSVKMEELTRVPTMDTSVNANAVRAFMGSLESEDAKKALEIADELADMIIFHARVRKNAEKMMALRKE